MNNVEFLKQIYVGSEGLEDKFTSDFTIFSPGTAPTAGTFVGRETALAHVENYGRLSGGSYKMESLGTFLADDNFGLAVSRITAVRDGRNLDMIGFGLWKFENGKAAAHWECPENLAEWDAFWS